MAYNKRNIVCLSIKSKIAQKLNHFHTFNSKFVKIKTSYTNFKSSFMKFTKTKRLKVVLKEGKQKPFKVKEEVKIRNRLFFLRINKSTEKSL